MLAGGIGPALPAGAVCPVCGGELGRWGRRGYRRFVRAGGETTVLWVLRGVCRSCGATHALLPSFLHPRRRDLVEAIGAALVGSVAGRGYRGLAVCLGVPETTVRDWLRRLRRRAGLLCACFLRLTGLFGVEAPRAPPGDGPLAWLLAAIAEAYRAARVRLGAGAVAGGLWAFASAACGGTLLAYTDPPW